jgi:hypothetical protein
MNWTEAKRMMLQKYPRCQVMLNVKGRLYQCQLTAKDLDHCLIRRNKKFEKYINGLEWNWQPACEVCNRLTHATDTHYNREAWLKHQVKEYGLERILSDMQDAPDKMQLHNTDWLEVMGWLKEMQG